MKRIIVLNLLIFISNFGFSQIDYIDSFIETNRENSLELFGTDDLYITNNGYFIYAFSDTSILRYQRDTISGKAISVKLFNDRLYGINSTSFCHRNYAITSDEKFLYLVGNCYDAISIFQLNSITGDCLFIDTVVNNQGGVVGLDMPYSLSISYDNRFLYVAAMGDNQITIFSINQDDGTLSYQGANNHSTLGNVNLVKTTPDNEFLYSTSDTDSSLIIFKRDIDNGLLTFQKKINRNYENQYFFKSISDIDFDLNGHIFITAQNDNALNVFKIHASYDSLIHEKSFKEGRDNVSGLDKPIAVEVSSDKKLIYVISNNIFVKTAISAFKWNKHNEINFVGGNIYESPAEIGMLYFPSNLKISPDSKFVYVSEMRNSISNFYKLGTFLNLGNDIELCTGDDCTIVAEETYFAYEWSDQSSDTSLTITTSNNISLQVTDEFGKIGRDTVMVTFNELPDVELGEDITLKFNDTILLSVKEGYESYLWNTGDITNSIEYIANCAACEDTTFSILVTNEYGCISIDSIEISINYSSAILTTRHLNLEIYPNPFVDYITISGNQIDKSHFIEIIDMSGKKVYFKKIDKISDNETLNLEELKKGLYIIKIYNENENFQRKILKSNSL